MYLERSQIVAKLWISKVKALKEDNIDVEDVIQSI